MTSFLHRLIQLNAPLISRTLRRLADQVDASIPGPPIFGLIIYRVGGKFIMGQITVSDDSSPLAASVSFVDAEGHPTTADDIPQWSSSDESVGTVAASEDGLSAVVEIGGPGATVIMVETTNDDGTTAAATGTITVEPGQATLGSVEFTSTEVPVP